MGYRIIPLDKKEKRWAIFRPAFQSIKKSLHQFCLEQSDLKFSKSKDMCLGFCHRPAPSGAKPGVSESVSTGTGSVSRGIGSPWKGCRNFSKALNRLFVIKMNSLFCSLNLEGDRFMLRSSTGHAGCSSRKLRSLRRRRPEQRSLPVHRPAEDPCAVHRSWCAGR